MAVAEGFELHLEKVLDEPYESLVARLRAGPQSWLPGFEQDGDRLTAELATEQAGRRVRRRIEVRTGPVQRFGYGVTVRIEWRGAQHPELYPRLEGHLRLERRQLAGSRLRLDARYTPPGGAVGAAIDRAVMHRVAESSTRDFVDRVAKLLASPPAETGIASQSNAAPG